MNMRAPLAFALTLLAAGTAIADEQLAAAPVTLKIDALNIVRDCSAVDDGSIGAVVGSGKLNCAFSSNGLEKADTFAASTTPLSAVNSTSLFGTTNTAPFQ
jgi:hypothetical protein